MSKRKVSRAERRIARNRAKKRARQQAVLAGRVKPNKRETRALAMGITNALFGIAEERAREQP
jgi:hypothetical protein